MAQYTTTFPHWKGAVWTVSSREERSFYTNAYHQMLRGIDVQLLQQKSISSPFLSWNIVEHLFLFHIGLLVHLIDHSTYLYKIGLQLLFQELPERPFVAYHPVPESVSSQPVRLTRYPDRICDPAGRSFPWPSEVVKLEVPDWITTSTQHVVPVLPRGPNSPPFYLDLDTGSAMSTLIKTVNKKHFPPEIQKRDHSGSNRKQRSLHLTKLPSLFTGKLSHQTLTAKVDPVLHFFYERHSSTRQSTPEIVFLPTYLSWKLSLRVWRARKNLEFGSVVPSQTGHTCGLIAKAKAALDNTPLCEGAGWHPYRLIKTLSGLRQDTPFRGALQSSSRNSLRPPRSPVIIYRYEGVQRKPRTLLTTQSLRVKEVGLQCLLEAATRTWVLTQQGNPFGKITTLNYGHMKSVV